MNLGSAAGGKKSKLERGQGFQSQCRATRPLKEDLGQLSLRVMGLGPPCSVCRVLWLSDPFIQQGLLRRLLMGPIDILCFTLDLLSPLQDKDTWSDLTPSLTSGLNWIFVSSFSFF